MSIFRTPFHTFLFVALFTLSQLAGAAPIPAPPEVTATGHLLIDFDSGVILSEKNANTPLEPASLTKIMTAYVILREIKGGSIGLDDEVLVSKKAWRTPGSRMFIEVNKKVPVKLLLKGMIIQSGNDASVALAEHVAGSEETFARLMNEHAQRLGMKDTHFVNSTGLPTEGHHTTAHDIALITEALIREFPEYYTWFSQKEFTFNDITQHNRNKLLWRDKDVDGVKTGHTDSAGFCLVASAKKNNMRLISVVMGTGSEESRAKESQKLLSYGFRFYETHRLYGAKDPIAKVRIWKGEREQLHLGIAQDLYVTIPRGQYKSLKARMNIPPRITAPIAGNKEIGSVEVTLGDEAITTVPLIALESVPEGGIWPLVKDTVLLWFE